MRLRSVVLLAGLASAAGPVRAEPALRSSVDRTTVAVGETFQLTVEVAGVSGGMAQPALPPMPGLEASAAGQTQNVQIVNGQMTSSIIFVYAVVARTPGQLTIPALAMNLEGKAYSTQPIVLNITAQPAGGGAAGGGPRPLFLDASVSKTRAYVGEQVTYAVQVYRRVQFIAQPQFSWPSFSGFITQDLGQRDSQTPKHGVNYSVTELRTALFPTAAGDYAIPPAQLRATIAEGGSADPFAMFFQSGRNVNIASPALKVVVLPLPTDGKPAGFNGAVGEYHLEATLDHARVEAGRPVTLTVAISGRGLVSSLREPAWPDMPGMRRYETLTDLKVQPGGNVVSGTKTFKVTLIPLNSGKIKLPSITYPVFDPEQRRYVTLRSSALELTVKPGTGAIASGLPAGPGPAGVKTITADIRFLKPAGEPSRSARPAWSPGFLGAQIPPLLLFLAGSFAAWRRRALASDPAGARSRGARRAAERRLRAAAGHVGAGDAVAVSVALHEAVVNYLADRWSIAAAGLTLAEAEARLRAAGASPEVIAGLRTFWDEADLIRYAPQTAARTDPAAQISAARSLLDVLERLR